VRRANTRTPQATLPARPAARASTTLILQKLRPVTAPTVARASPALLLALLWTPPAQSVALDSTRGREQVYRNDKKPCQMIYEFHVCYIHPLFNSTINHLGVYGEKDIKGKFDMSFCVRNPVT